MGYVELSGLGVSPFGAQTERVIGALRKSSPVLAKKLAVKKPVSPLVKRVVSQVKAIAPVNLLRNFRPPAGVGVTTVRSAPVHTVIPAQQSLLRWGKNVVAVKNEVRAVAQARPSIYPAGPLNTIPRQSKVQPLVSVEPVRKVILPSGLEYKNTQVKVQAGVDPNRPESWVAPAAVTGAALSIQEPVPSNPISFTASPEQPTTEEESGAQSATQSAPFIKFDPVQVNMEQSTGSKVVQAGFPWVVGGLLVLVFLGMRKKGGR